MKTNICILALIVLAGMSANARTVIHLEAPEVIRTDLIGLERLGIIPELGVSSLSTGMSWLRFEIPDKVEGRKLHFATVKLYIEGVPVTSLTMDKVGIGKKEYVTMELNPEIVTNIEVKFHFYGNFNYEASIDVKSISE